jgi:hypothetical protein
MKEVTKIVEENRLLENQSLCDSSTANRDRIFKNSFSSLASAQFS